MYQVFWIKNFETILKKSEPCTQTTKLLVGKAVQCQPCQFAGLLNEERNDPHTTVKDNYARNEVVSRSYVDGLDSDRVAENLS